MLLEPHDNILRALSKSYCLFSIRSSATNAAKESHHSERMGDCELEDGTHRWSRSMRFQLPRAGYTEFRGQTCEDLIVGAASDGTRSIPAPFRIT